MTFLPKLMFCIQLAKSQDYSKTPTGFSQLPGHQDGSTAALGDPCTSTSTVST